MVPNISRSIMQQLKFNWEVEDKYSNLKNFTKEVNHILQHVTNRKNRNNKILAMQEGLMILRHIDTGRTRKM